ncbi:MAG: LysM peptidoglycan-binding domain-containing protein [Verrucomicrobiaceae bacterium]|nr:LysM peptidoglycan-binding domain-containing protein [Verrucomicrobiaceae bacterium]
MSKKNKPSLLSMIEHERHRVAASISDPRSSEWSAPTTPNRGVAKIFVVMLVVHILVVAGLIIYDFASGGSTQTITEAPVSSGSESASMKPENAPSSSGVSAVDPRNDTPAVPAAPARLENLESEPDTKPAGTTAAIPPLPIVSTTPAITAGSQPVESASSSSGMPTLSPSSARVDLAAALEPQSVAAETPVTITEVQSALPADQKIDLAMVSKSEASTAPYTPPTTTEEVKAEAPAKAPEQKPVAKTETKPKSQMRTAPTITKSNSTTTASKATAAPATARSGSGRHTVVKGDTLGAIAKRYKTSTEAIMRANGIKNPNNISLGAKLLIPK